ncbi:uncharacterized protein BX664DRAFT_342075 [Halteromyces radiatus]|uniref:uncharacterized protein n=1 Tax=Halteromyces radiatus TaxID=101107 RepID=UPI00221E65DE|nr:uncharacterized protein BX664DRAFT_342075 [Halteromyces radiatus]KAI8080015.1 hypothetical protein BX664DRAFT_342075 [Halteromyces radiatus]
MDTTKVQLNKQCLPDVRIDKSIALDHANNLKELAKYRQSFGSQRKFWVDVAVLDRLNYKNKNQQRHFHRFKRTCEARRLLKRFKTLEIDNTLIQLQSLFWSGIPKDRYTAPPTTIPCRESCEFALRKMIAAAVILDKLQVVLVEVYRENSTLLRLEHFVSVALVHMSICARLYTLAHKWVNELENCYKLVQSWHLAFPYASKKIKAQASMEDYPNKCTSSTMEEERKKAREWNQIRLSYKNPIHFEFFLTHQADQLPTLLQQQQQMDIDSESQNLDLLENDINDDLDDLGEIIARD